MSSSDQASGYETSVSSPDQASGYQRRRLITKMSQTLDALKDFTPPRQKPNPWHGPVAGLIAKVEDTGRMDARDRLVRTIEKQIRQVKFAEEAHVFSAPYDVARSEMKRIADGLSGDGIFVLNPDVDLEVIAQANGMNASVQSKRWLEIWTDCFWFAQEMKLARRKGQLHFMVCRMPAKNSDGVYDVDDIDRTLVGNAQHGELRIAMAGGFLDEASGLHFHVFKPEEPQSLLELRRAKKEIIFNVLDAEAVSRHAKLGRNDINLKHAELDWKDVQKIARGEVDALNDDVLLDLVRAEQRPPACSVM